MADQRGASIEAAQRAEDMLVRRNQSAADTDAAFQSLLHSAHQKARQYGSRLDSIEVEVNQAAARVSLDNPASVREFQRFLRDKYHEILSVLNDAQGASTEMAAQVGALGAQYQSPASADGDATASRSPSTADDTLSGDRNGHVFNAGFGTNHAPLPLDGAGDSVRSGGDIPHWSDKQLFPTDPSAADIKQSAIGDCYLAATMGAIARANPQWIKDRIHFDDRTGTFDVTLWNGHDWQHIPVTQNDIQIDHDNHGVSGPDPAAPIWPSVLESAYAKMHSPGDDLGHALNYGIGKGGLAPDALQALTGNRGVSIDPERVWWTRQHIDQEITQALHNHQPVTLSAGPHGGPLVSDHTYIVEGITGTGSDAQVTLRNPWASNPNDPHNPLITVRLGDVIGSGLTGKLDSLGTHPMDQVNIGAMGR